MPRLSLTTRAFLFSFLPVCLVLGASFVALSTAIHQKVRDELRESLQSSDELLNRANLEFEERTNGLLAKLTDSAGLKAAVGLLAEAGGDPSATRQVRTTIENQLSELQGSSIYDVLAVSNLHGRTVAAVLLDRAKGLDELPSLPTKPGLAEFGGALYQLQSVPIEIGSETVATLTLGTRFEISRLPLAGQAILLRGNRIVRSSFAAGLSQSIEDQIAKRCTNARHGCEIAIHGETFVVSELHRAQLGESYRLLGFRSLDARLRQFNDSFLRILFEVGAGGILLALTCTLITSRSVSQPIRELVSQLGRSEANGGLPQDLKVDSAVRELDALAGALNRSAAAERRARGELEGAKLAAETANRLKTEFLTNVSHELRTPMNGIVGMADLLLGTTLNGEQSEYTNVVRECAKALTAIIDDILDFSRLESGKLPLEKRPFDLGSVLTEATSEARTRAGTKAVRIDLRVPSPPPPRSIGDQTRIRQVLRVLLDNAIKFNDRGFVQVRCECNTGDGKQALVRISVEDTGIGIAPQMFDFIFERFTQADGSLTRRHGGTGLGLALAKDAVELMGGQIGVNSEVGRGSTFWFTLTLEIAESLNRLEAAVATAIESPS